MGAPARPTDGLLWPLLLMPLPLLSPIDLKSCVRLPDVAAALQAHARTRDNYPVDSPSRLSRRPERAAPRAAMLGEHTGSTGGVRPSPSDTGDTGLAADTEGDGATAVAAEAADGRGAATGSFFATKKQPQVRAPIHNVAS